MNRLPFAALPLLLTAAAGALAAIPVEERSLTGAPALAGTPAAGAGAAGSGAGAAAPAGNAMWDQFTQLQQLQQQVGQLQGMIEQQNYQIEKLQNDLRVRYTDLDQRLTAQQEQMKQQQLAAPAGMAMGDSGATAAAGPGASGATLEEEKRAYLAAYDTFRAGGPDKAIPPMLAFVKRYPYSTFVPSAYYWLGEFYLNASTPDQDAARRQFETVLNEFPSNPKAPAALYKVAAILDMKGQPQEAQKKMKELTQKYPGSPEAALAENYLKALEAASSPAPSKSKSTKVSKKN